MRRRRPEPGAAPAPTGSDPRDDLRQKLAEARGPAADAEDFEVAGMAAETVVVDDEPAQADDVDALRRRVHEEARAVAEEMKRREESQ